MIGIVSGKGGVGKSLVTSLLATSMRKENMAYFQCPTCHDKHFIFGKSDVDKLAAKYNIGMSAQIPIDPNLAIACDNGNIEEYDTDWLAELTGNI